MADLGSQMRLKFVRARLKVLACSRQSFLQQWFPHEWKQGCFSTQLDRIFWFIFVWNWCYTLHSCNLSHQHWSNNRKNYITCSVVCQETFAKAGIWCDGSLTYTSSEERSWAPFLPQDSEWRKLRCIVRSEDSIALLLQSCYWKSLDYAVREEAAFSPLWKLIVLTSRVTECSHWKDAVVALLCWLLSNYLNSGNEAHPSVISPVTSPWCTKGASRETIVLSTGEKLFDSERIAVHFRLEVINEADCCAVWSHLADLSENKLVRKQKGSARASGLSPLLVCRVPE